MKLQFKHQKFQADAAKAVVDVFAGQPYLVPSYMMDKGTGLYQQTLTEEEDFTGWSNHKIIPELSDKSILEHINSIQRANQIKPSSKLEGRFNLTIEMETGVGKTYTYIKTMYELNRAYGWSKFIVVVPSIAIREGVYKSFQVTQDHFAEEYGKKIRFFIYNSAQLTQIDHFASDSSINVMIINSQAFNAKGKDARRIYMKLDEFRSRRPIDIIAKTNPIVIIDEPQSVEGKQTKENLKQFNPLMTLRYSATHKLDSIYNMIYRLDALEAYNKRLVKKIAVKGITESGSTATESYVYLEGINLSKSAPTATIQFDMKGSSGIRKVTRTVSEGYNLYDNSGQMEEYKHGFVVSKIDGRDDSVEFINGIKLYAGDVIGKVSEDQLRRIQIRETILSHIQRERELFSKGIKVLSLFFIDEVAKYKQYDEAGQPLNGTYAEMFEEEYKDVISHLQITLGEDEYMNYLSAIPAEMTHAGYFSIDKKGKMVDSKVGRKETTTDDVDAYDLIMKNKELLLDRDPKKSPVRFIFSHSALREGWDNPNVFQICTLRDSDAEIKKRQEIGRGLRLCVDQNGIRQDAEILGENLVHDTNVLTVIANESYESFANSLQSEFNEIIARRPKDASASLFNGKIIQDASGEKTITLDDSAAADIYMGLVNTGLVDKVSKQLTDAYHSLNDEQKIQKVRESVGELYAPFAENINNILSSVYDSKRGRLVTNNRNSEKLELDKEKFASKKFKELWYSINEKTYYTVEFDDDELIERCVDSLNRNMRVTKTEVIITEGLLKTAGKDKLEMYRSKIGMPIAVSEIANDTVKYDIISELSRSYSDGGTGLTRKAIASILSRIEPSVFHSFKTNPEEFIHNAIQLINDQKASTVVKHIEYDKLNEKWDSGEIFINESITGEYGYNLIDTPDHHLYDKLRYDSEVEKNFARELEKSDAVEVYVKLPKRFYINTPMGNYNPDWAIAFKDEAGAKHIYFVAETKGVSEGQLDVGVKGIEKAKIECARKHFEKISNGDRIYGVCNSYEKLLELVSY